MNELLNNSAEWKDGRLLIKIDDEVVRNFEPNDRSTYRFTYQGEEFYIFYSVNKNREIYFYPVNTFEEEKITIQIE